MTVLDLRLKVASDAITTPLRYGRGRKFEMEFSNKLDLALAAVKEPSLPTKATTRVAPSGRAALVRR